MCISFLLLAYLIQHGYTSFMDGQGAMMALMYGSKMSAMAFAITGDLGKAKVAAHDIFGMLNTESKIDGLEPSGVSPVDLQQIGRFEFQDVQFYYPFRPDVQVLKGMSFRVEAGQSVGVVGPSGGGKSTIMAMIQRFYDPQQGQILIGADRLALDSVNIRWWRRQVGFVGQEPILFNCSVLENVQYGLEEGETVSMQRLEECKRMAHLSFIDHQKAQGWDTVVGPRGSRLSGGQKQRVAICRALVRNPPLLLLDEATSALDNTSEKIVSKALEAARGGRTSFSIAHRLSTVEECDLILVTAEGRIVE